MQTIDSREREAVVAVDNLRTVPCTAGASMCGSNSCRISFVARGSCEVVSSPAADARRRGGFTKIWTPSPTTAGEGLGRPPCAVVRVVAKGQGFCWDWSVTTPRALARILAGSHSTALQRLRSRIRKWSDCTEMCTLMQTRQSDDSFC